MKIKLSIPMVYDFMALLIAFDAVVANQKINKQYVKELFDFFAVDVAGKKECFAKNTTITSTFEFMSKATSYFYYKHRKN